MSCFYSIGHSSLPIDTFVDHLARFAIEIVADVRRFPSSRRHPQFERESLAASLSEAGVDYRHLGDELGGYREGSYEEHAESAAFARGIERLEAAAGEGVVAFLCAEKYPWHCHRRFIAEALEARGHVVRHVAGGQLLLAAEGRS